jgi:site-specific recombinase XerD
VKNLPPRFDLYVNDDVSSPADTSGGWGGQVIEQFGRYQRGRGFSDATIKRRTLTLRSLQRFLEPKTLGQATTMDLEEFLAAKPAARTRHAYRSDIRTFYAWAVRRDLLTANPASGLESVKVPKSLPRPLADEAARSLLLHGDRVTRQMVALGLFAGLRCAEIASLCAEDVWIHGDECTVVVRDGKGAKDRSIPMSSELRDILGKVPNSGPLFPGKNGRRTVVPGTVSARIRRHLARAGIDGVPHQLRHTFGTAVARRSGGDVVLTASWMGHGSTDTTMGYIRLTAGRGREFIECLFDAPPAA